MNNYLEEIFIKEINNDDIKIIFELGSRDLIDAIKMQKYYNCQVYAFECNPDCLELCRKNFNKNVYLIESAVSINDGFETFYPFDLHKYNNIGASSMLKIDFTKRNKNDPDYNRPNPQKEITVPSTRLDTFMNKMSIKNIDLLCMDLQGYELNALKSLSEKINNIKYIITETCINSTYTNGTTFSEINEYLENYGFKYICSDEFKYEFPNTDITGFSEFNALFRKN